MTDTSKTELRRIAPMSLPDVVPAPPAGSLPTFEMADPSNLFVDRVYQRDLSERSVRLIRKMLEGWDWTRFKPPVCVCVGDVIHVLDGQHTAIAAAAHPAITEIPIMLVAAEGVQDRARAFVGHNRDRINVTGIQLHHAALAAGDEDAMTVQQVCDRAGVTLLRYPPPSGVFRPGETLALASVRGVINRFGVIKARQTLEVLRDAKVAPISADLIKATAELLFSTEYAGSIKPADLATVIRGLGPRVDAEARALSLAKGLSRWRALVIVIFKGRRGSGSRSAA